MAQDMPGKSGKFGWGDIESPKASENSDGSYTGGSSPQKG